jgi:hypothetical protein
MTRLDRGLAALLIAVSIPTGVAINNQKVRILAFGIAVSSFIYILISCADRSDSEITLPVRTKSLYVLSFCLLASTVLLSPIGWTNDKWIFDILFSILTLVTAILSIDSKTSEYGRIISLLSLAIVVRFVLYYQYPTPAGFDSVIAHIPAILDTLDLGYITSPSYYELFFVSQLRTVSYMIIADITIKNGLFIGLYLSEGLSILFVYLFLRRPFPQTVASLASIVVAVSPFHIIYGATRIPQSTSVALVPLLLFTIFYLTGRRGKSVSLLVFVVILLCHNITPWVLIFFGVILYLLEYLPRDLSQSPVMPSLRRQKIGYLLITFLSIKMYYIFISEYYYNVGRISNIIAFILGYKSFGGVPTASDTTSVGVNYIFLRFASVYLFISIFVAIGGFLLLSRIEKRKLASIDSWLITGAIFWGIFAVTTLFGPNYGTERISASALILLSPVIALVFQNILKIKGSKLKISVVVILLITASFIGAVHPRSNVGGDYRTERIALTSEEVSAITWSSKKHNNIHTDQYASNYDWLIKGDLQPTGSPSSISGIYMDRFEYASSTHSRIYHNGDVSISVVPPPL